MTARRFAPARPVAVTTDPATGLPTGLRWRGRDERVAHVEAIWATDTAWWAREQGAVRRRYVRLLTQGGLLCVVFHDLASGRWYLDAVMD